METIIIHRLYSDERRIIKIMEDKLSKEFQTVFKNISSGAQAGPLEYHLDHWQVVFKGKRLKMKTREYWGSFWKKQGIPQAAQIAFNWALLPTYQVYRAGDYNWGMSLFGLKPGAVFDLKVTWKQNGKTRSGIIPSIKCATNDDVRKEQGGK